MKKGETGHAEFITLLSALTPLVLEVIISQHQKYWSH